MSPYEARSHPVILLSPELKLFVLFPGGGGRRGTRKGLMDLFGQDLGIGTFGFISTSL